MATGLVSYAGGLKPQSGDTGNTCKVMLEWRRESSEIQNPDLVFKSERVHS